MRLMLGAGAAALLLSACSGADGGGDDDAADPDPIEDVCALLSPEDATRIVGASYLRADEPAPDLAFPLCSYEQTAPEAPFTLTVSAGEGDVEDAARGLRMAGEVTEEPVEVPGADAAAVLRTDDGDISVEQVVAEAGGNVYVVTFGGATEVAVRLLSAALGAPVVEHSGPPVSDVCDLDTTVVAALGGTAERQAGPAEEAWSSCSWDTGSGTSVTLSAARDAGDLDRYLAEHGFVPDGVEQQSVAVSGAEAALLVTDPATAVSSATALGQVGAVVYEVEVTDAATQRAGDLATDLLAASIGSL